MDMTSDDSLIVELLESVKDVDASQGLESIRAKLGRRTRADESVLNSGDVPFQ